MAKKWDEKLSSLSVKLADLSKKAADAAEDAKAYQELRKEVIEDKISTAKGNVAALEENVRLSEEERKGKIRSELLKIRMTAKAKKEDLKDSIDKKRLERYIDDGIAYIHECYDIAELLLSDAEVTALEVVDALKEYEERYGSEADE